MNKEIRSFRIRENMWWAQPSVPMPARRSKVSKSKRKAQEGEHPSEKNNFLIGLPGVFTNLFHQCFPQILRIFLSFDYCSSWQRKHFLYLKHKHRYLTNSQKMLLYNIFKQANLSVFTFLMVGLFFRFDLAKVLLTLVVV